MTSQKENLHSIRLRLVLLLVFGTLALVTYFLLVTIMDHHQEQTLFQSRLSSKVAIFNSTVKNDSTQLRTFAYDYTYWDDMVNFVKSDGRDTNFAEENLAPGLTTFGADAIWIYNPSHQLIYSTGDSDISYIDLRTVTPIDASQMGTLFAHNGVYHYYTKVNAGVFEIYAASIHPSADAERKTPASGYFFVGRLLDKGYLAILNQSIEGSTQVLSGPGVKLDTGYDIENGKISFGQQLSDYRGEPLAVLSAEYTAADLRNVLSSQDKVTVAGISILTLLTLGLMVLLLRWVISPMNKVRQALTQSDERPIHNLMSRQDEFGSIARLVSQSFSQQKLLVSQRQTVEREVAERTSQLQIEQRTLATLLDNLPVGVFVAKAPGGEPTIINKVGVKLLGRDINHSIKWHDYSEYYDIIKEDGSSYPPEDLPLSISLHQHKRVLKDDVVILQPDGKHRSLRVISSPIILADGKVQQAVAVFEDISKEQELERTRDEFFSIASHELRTPLTAIRGNTSLIQQYYQDLLKDPDLHEIVDDIHDSSIRLIGIVNDFLDTSRLEQKHMKFQLAPLDITELAKSVVEEFQVTGSRQKTLLEVKQESQPLPKIMADSNRTRQVLINLLGNALKFTDHGSITISFELTDGFVKTKITDSGQGMSAEAQTLLFRKFEQTGATVLTRDSVRGTGLGLYISKLIVEQMGGHIKLESSTPGVGTVFSFILPVAPPGIHSDSQ